MSVNLSPSTFVQSVDIELNDFSQFYASLMNLQVFNHLLVTVSESQRDFENEIALLSTEKKDACRRIFENMFMSVRDTKREVSSSLSQLHFHLTKVMLSLENSQDNSQALNQKLKTLNKWLVEMDVSVEEQNCYGGLTDYYKELEDIKQELQKLAHDSESIHDTFVRIANHEKQLKRDLEAEIKKSEKFEHKYTKAKESFEDLKEKYQELFKKHEKLLNTTNELRVEVNLF